MGASNGPHPVEGRWVGALFVRGFIARGRRATVWWADSDLGPVALRVPHPERSRARFDAEQRAAYAASGRRGELRAEGAAEAMIRGDDWATLTEGAASNGPVDALGLAALAHGVLTDLLEHPEGHGDLVPGHVLVGEGGTVRLVDAAPARFREQAELPGRAPWPPRTPSSVHEGDAVALFGLLRVLWGAARLPDEAPPTWLAPVCAAGRPDRALELLERALPELGPTQAGQLRARLTRRLCPERREAWARLAAASIAPPPELEPEPAAEPTRVDVLHDTVDDSIPPELGGALDGLELPEEGDAAPFAVREPPSLDLPPEAAVPTRVVRRRGASVGSPALIDPSPDRGAEAPAPRPGSAGAVASPKGLDATAPEGPRARLVSEEPAEGPMVLPVPDDDLARSTRDRVLTVALVGVVVGLVGLVLALAHQQGLWP